MALLDQQVLNALPVDRPVWKRNLRVAQAVIRVICQGEFVHHTAYLLGGSRWTEQPGVIFCLLVLILTEVEIDVRDICLKERMEIFLIL